jgi:hypothetical protein
MKSKEPVKYFEVRLYPNSTFKVIEVKEDFHESSVREMSLCYNGDTKEQYHRLIAEEKNIDKAKLKIAKSLLRDSKKELDAAQKKFDFLSKTLNKNLS